MEPVSSSDEASSHSSYCAERGGNMEALKSLDDLPSDDSCADELMSNSSDDDVSKDDDEDQSSSQDENSSGGSDEEDEEEMTLQQRIMKKRYEGKKGGDKEKKIKMKKLALEKARNRVKSSKTESSVPKSSIKSKKKKRNDNDLGFFLESENEPNVHTSSNLVEGKKVATSLCSESDAVRNLKKKKSKHAPTEMSSKRKDFFQRGAPNLQNSGLASFGTGLYKPRDPRMQSLSGYFDQNLFDQSYGFLEDIRDKEIGELKARIDAQKATGRAGQRKRRQLGLESDAHALEEDQRLLTKLLQERADRKKAREKRAAKQAVKRTIRNEVAEGKRGAYYLNRKDQKKLELEARFEELKAAGGDAAVDKAIAKKRKKNAKKDQKLMPI